MAADEFRRRMYNDVCSVFDRSYKVRSRKGVVDHERNLMRMCKLCNCFNVNDIGIRIAERLDKDRFCIFLNSCLYFFQIENIYKGRIDTKIREGVCEEIEGTAVNIFCRYDVVSGLCQILKGIGYRRCSGCDCQRCHTALKRCDTLLEHILGRVCQSAVNVSCIGKSEARRCMIAVVKYIRRGLINRNRSRSGHRIRLFLSYVKL